jgi:dCTP deaminase
MAAPSSALAVASPALPGFCSPHEAAGGKPQSRRRPAAEFLNIPGASRRTMLKSDRWIRKMAVEHDMINPFSEKQVSQGVISFGVSSYGYDLRVADEFKIFTNVNCTVVDPKHFDERSFVTLRTDVAIIPPNSFALARSVEYFKIPRDVLTICVGKSTYARCGIIVNVTPFEPEWEGFVTLEISNTTPLPARIYANEGLCQILFLQSDEMCEVSYKDRKGKYQAQKGIVLPKL